MSTPQYSTDGITYYDMTADMLAGSYNGMFELVYPQPTALTLDGRPCGAFGLPMAVLRSRVMPVAGMTRWQSCFTAPDELACRIWLDVYDPYNHGLTRVTGWLQRPRWQRVRAAARGNLVLYENVEIIVTEVLAV